MFTLTLAEVWRYVQEVYMEIGYGLRSLEKTGKNCVGTQKVNKVQGSPTALESALGANDKPQQELGIYGSFRPMIWFFIMLWSILGFVALGEFSKLCKNIPSC